MTMPRQMTCSMSALLHLKPRRNSNVENASWAMITEVETHEHAAVWLLHNICSLLHIADEEFRPLSL